MGCEISGSPCAAGLIEDQGWPLPNVWLGVSVEDQKTADERIPLLLQTPAAVRWVSYEPALGPVDFTEFIGCGHRKYDGDIICPMCGMCRLYSQFIDWLVIGGESGPGARPFNIQWARDVIAQCKAAGVPCFMKQLGARPVSKCNGPLFLHDRKGGCMDEWPSDLRVREYPEVK